MTRTPTRAYGVVTPPHIQPLLDAALRAFAWLVSNVVSLSGMIFNRNTRDWHTGIAEEGLHRTSNDITKGTNSGPPGPRPAVDAQIVSKDGGVLTALSPLIPTKVGNQGRPRTLSKPAASSLRLQHNRSWIPTFVGMSG